MKKFFYLLMVVGVFTFFSEQSVAQPQPFAGGEIVINYIGSPSRTADNPAGQPCGDAKWYEFIVKLYRDCGGATATFPLNPVLHLYNSELVGSTTNNGFFIIPITEIDNRGTIDNLCINGDPICTQGKWYRGVFSLTESETRWQIVYGRMRELAVNGRRVIQSLGDLVHSPDQLNIDQAQPFSMKSEVLVKCDELTTGSTGGPPNVTVKNNLYNNKTATLITEDIVETFCHAKEYEFQLPIEDQNNVRLDLNLDGTITSTEGMGADSLKFELTSAFKSPNTTTFYTPPYSSTNPVPAKFPTKLTISKEGFFEYSPELLPTEPGFVGAVTIRVTEYRKAWIKEEVPQPDGSIKDTLILKYPDYNEDTEIDPISITTRQFRYVIDRSCNENLPEFESTTWNAAEAAWQFDCEQNTLNFELTKPMLAKSLERKDFRLIRGPDSDTPLDDNPYPIDSIVILDENQLGEFTKMRIYVYPESAFGPGRYTLHTKLGDDKNTLINRCGFQLPEKFDIPIFKRDQPFVFDYITDTLDICFPQDAIAINPLVGQSSVFQSKAGLFTYKYIPTGIEELDTTILRSPTFFRVPDEFDNNGDLIKKSGLWKVGVGLVFDYTYNGKSFQEVCYDEDDVFVNIFENKSVSSRDWDLCPGEDWPVINLDTMSTLYAAEDYRWGLETDQTDKDGNPIYRPVGGSSNAEVKNDKFPIASVAFGEGNLFTIQSVVQLENGECFDTSYFRVQKNEVKVDIGQDSILCKEDRYILQNSISYFTPDSMSYEWYLDDVLLPEADSNSVQITEEGIYKLVVFKRSELDKSDQQVICMGEDTVKITFADSLYAPRPECSKVTFDGDIKQTFFWPAIDGADGYQVRTIKPDGSDDSDWLDPNGDYNQLHNTLGQEVKLVVRAYNLEVDEDATCRYGPESTIAPSCEVIVKPVNIFTPNGDGVNDKLRFDLLEVYEGNQLQIFDRWGKLIYESNNYQNDWDGEDFNEGTYFYILKIDDPAGTNTLMKGNVTLVR